MPLNSRILGHGKPLLILHGLYGSGDNWLSLAHYFETSFQIHLIDQRNHGLSIKSTEFNYQLMSMDLEEYIQHHSLSSVAILGHSMGGKTAMQFAHDRPHLVNRLIVADIAPKAYTFDNSKQAHFHKRIISDLLALQIEDSSSRSDIDAKLQSSVPNSAIRNFLLKNVKRNKDGVFYWQINLPALQENLENIMGNIDTISPIFTPTLFIKGGVSDYLQTEDQAAIERQFPKAEFTEIAGAGHWLHAEEPEYFSKLVLDFLSR